MKVTFCLPHPNFRSPIGGYKIVYEYANRLHKMGFEISIVYCTKNFLREKKIPKTLKKAISDFIVMLSPRWFKLNRKIKKYAAYEIEDDEIKDGDIIFATAVTTAEKVAQLSETKGKKFYLIQDYENWIVGDKKVIASYKLGMRNIVISNWLYKIVKRYSDNVECIINPIDLNVFKVKYPVSKRNKYCIGLLYHKSEYKGVKYALQALYELKMVYPQLHVIMFGNTEPPAELPEWFEYKRNVSSQRVCDIYNQCSIFLCASIEEGFGLTGLESMACGCAFVTTGYKGVYEYAIDGYNALISPIRDSHALCNNMKSIIENDKLREKLVLNSLCAVKKFSWDEAISKMEMSLNNQ